MHVVESGQGQRIKRVLATDSVQGCQCHPYGSGAAADPGRALRVVVDLSETAGLHWRPAYLVGMWSPGHRGLYFPVDRGDDLHPAVEKHLVAVVCRGVVRRGDLDAGRRGQVPDGVGGHRRRDGRDHQQHVEALGRKDFSGRQGEFVGAVSSVATHHHVVPAQATILEYLSQCPGGADDDGEVHRIGAASQRSAETGGTESQRIAEPAVEFFGTAGG